MCPSFKYEETKTKRRKVVYPKTAPKSKAGIFNPDLFEPGGFKQMRIWIKELQKREIWVG